MTSSQRILVRASMYAALLAVPLVVCGGHYLAHPGVEIAVTFDDLPPRLPDPADHPRQAALNARLLEALDDRDIAVTGFVNERNLEVAGRVDERRVALLRAWLDGGHELGNHSWSHLDLHRVGAAAFIEDVQRGDRVTRTLIAEANATGGRFFRHPFLHTGQSAPARDSVHTALVARGYTVAPVTIDNYDYVFAAAYDSALARGSAALADSVRTAYVNYMLAATRYYEDQAVAITGAPIRQILLVHVSALNADAFGTLADSLAAGGRRFITLERALEDPVYRADDAFFGAAGITWLHRWAITRQLPRTIFRGEPEVPEWVAGVAAR